MTDKHHLANAVTVMQLRMASAANGVHVTAMAVIAESVAVSARSKTLKRHRKASFLIKTSQQPAWKLRKLLLNL